MYGWRLANRYLYVKSSRQPVFHLANLMQLRVMTYHRIQNTYFTTATIVQWRPMLETDTFKRIVTNSFEYLSRTRKVTIYAFVIMPNHIHVVWTITDGAHLKTVKHSLLSYTGHQFLKKIQRCDALALKYFRSFSADRRHQFWQRRSFDVPLVSESYILQKMGYIHRNPVKARLVERAENYQYSSAKSYIRGKSAWSFLTLYESQVLR